jgi:hypothetical protein
MRSMAASINLRKAHLTRVHGDIIAVYSWMDDERALFLIPHLRPGAPWYVVKESAAFKYDDPTYLASQCATACDVLGIEPSTANWVRVATIINEGLPDLVRMPSAPPTEFSTASRGQILLREDGKTIAGEDIRLEKTEGVSYGAV